MSQPHEETIRAVRAVLAKFQKGYTRRDVRALDAFMALFAPDPGVEVIGTGAVTPGGYEWCLDRAAVRGLVESDWLYWGDLRLDVEGAHIHTLGDAAWLAAAGTVSRPEGADESWPLRLTAVLARDAGGAWRFVQLHFSYGETRCEGENAQDALAY